MGARDQPVGLGHVPGRGRTPTKSWSKEKIVEEKAEKTDKAKAKAKRRKAAAEIIEAIVSTE